ncbi:MAG: undecaprenyl-diphosphate phosphatase [Bifidobacteriaceae bacterium]|jgi:undecaprenyl-diphosphatase|nr:undecaprenyl-diphosphate phosphatase [Bifidobacteriaceae bacterium]
MTIIQTLILGFVQGITEFLPVSSSLHLRLTSEILGCEIDTLYSAVIGLGTTIAGFVYFRKEVITILYSLIKCLKGYEGLTLKSRFLPKDKDARMGWGIIYASIPVIFIGAVFGDSFEQYNTYLLSGIFLAIFGIVLFLTDKYCSKKRKFDSWNIRDAFFVGIIQVLALFPGVSRSGSTITAGLFLGYNRFAATKFSFLMMLPIGLGSSIYEIIKYGDTITTPTLILMLIGATCSLLVGYIVINCMLNLIIKYSFHYIVLYRVLLGILIVILSLLKVLV